MDTKKIGNITYFGEKPKGHNDIFIFIPTMREIIQISEGTGDNLLPEDIEEGCVDYIYYTQHIIAFDFPEVDGGQVMLKELFVDKYECTADCIRAVLEMAYGDDSMECIVLA